MVDVNEERRLKTKLLNGGKDSIDMHKLDSVGASEADKETAVRISSSGGGSRKKVRRERINSQLSNDDEAEGRSCSSSEAHTLRLLIASSKRWIVGLISLCLVLSLVLLVVAVRFNMCSISSSPAQQQQQQLSTPIYKGDRFAHDFDTFHSTQQPSHTESKALHALTSIAIPAARSVVPMAATFPSTGISWNHSRLPLELRPLHYDITLRIDVNARKFTGNCSILLSCSQATRLLVVHADADLAFESPKYLPTIVTAIRGDHGRTSWTSIRVKRTTYNEFFQYMIVELGETLLPDRNYTVTFTNFSSPITSSLKGLYLSTYTSKNVTKSLVVSQLQPLDARRIFPSFDEPNLKARFSITIEHQKGSF